MVDKFTCDSIANILKAKHYKVREVYVEEYEFCDITAEKDNMRIYLEVDREDNARITIYDRKTLPTLPKTISEFKLPKDADFHFMIINLVDNELDLMLRYRIPSVTPRKVYEIL